MTRAIVVAAALVLAGCGPAHQAKPAVADLRYAVETAPVATRALSHRIVATGSLAPFEVVRATARVSGVVERMLVSEGDRVDAGQVVAEIEPERFRLGVRTAQAALDRARAVVDDAASGLKRREDLAATQPTLVKEEELAQYRARAAQADADLASARAALDKAELDLRDARVAAPMAGVIQARMVETGQYVQQGVMIATLVRRDPLRVRFSVAAEEARLLAVGSRIAFTVRDAPGDHTATVSFIAEQAEESSRLVPIIALVDPAVDAGGAVDARAQLRPGSFAQVVIELPGGQPAIAIPETAVRPSERGFLAYVLEKQGERLVVHERRLSLGIRTPDGGIEVRDGLSAGEQVVVRGGDSLREGAEVRVAPAAARPPGESGAGR